MSTKKNIIKKGGAVALATALVGSSLLSVLPVNVYATEAALKTATLKAAPTDATAVATFDQLKAALQNPSITNIKLTADIKVTSSFNFTTAKNLYGEGHTIDMNKYLIGISKSSLVNRIENINIINQDIYPLFWSTNSGVTVTYKDVTSDGEQFVYNSQGTTILEGNVVANTNHEEVYQGKDLVVKSGANVTFTSQTICPAIRVYGSVTQEANSSLKVTAKDKAIYGDGSNIQITTAGNMDLTSTTEQALYTSSSGGNMTVKSGAKFKATAGDKTEEGISLTSGNLRVENGADFQVISTGVQGSVQTGGTLVFENGSNFAITNTNPSGSVFANYSGSSTNININSDKGLSTWDSGLIDSEIPTHNYNDFETATFNLSGWDKGNLSQKNLSSNSSQFTSQFVSKTTGKLYGGSYALTHISQTTIEELTTNSTHVVGTAEPNASIIITNSQGVRIGEGRVGSDGNYDVTISKQAAGTRVTATASANGITSEASTIVQQAAIAQTTITPLTTDSTVASGTAEPNAKVDIYANGEVIGSGTANDKGEYAITIKAQDVGTRVTATATVDGVSSSATAVVTQGELAQTTIASLTTKSTLAEGTAEPNAMIVIETSTGEQLGSGKVGSDGKYSITIPKQPLDTVVIAKATINGKTSEARTTVVRGDIEQTTINKVTTESTNVSGTAEPNATIVIKDGSNNVIASGRAGSDGIYSFSIPKQAEGTLLVAEASADGFTSEASTLVVRDGINQTTINALTSESTIVSGTAEANASIVISNATGELGSGKVGSDGKYSITIPAQPAGTVVTAVATLGDKSSSASTTVTKQTKGTVVVNAPYYVGYDSNVQATVSGDVAKVYLLVDGTKYATVPVSGSFQYYAKDKITSLTSQVYLVGVDASGKELSRATVNLKDGNLLKGAVSAKEFIIGVDNYVTGSYTGSVTKVALSVNGTIYPAVPVVGQGELRYYAKDKVLKETDDVKVIGYNVEGRAVSTATVTVNGPDSLKGSIQPNPSNFVISTDSYVKGTFTGNVSSVSLVINGTEYAKVGVLDGTNWQYYAKGKITNATDTVSVKAYNAAGSLVDTKDLTVSQNPVGVSTLTPSVFNFKKDGYVKGTFTGSVKYVALNVNGHVYGKVAVMDATNWQYYAKDKITSAEDVVSVIGYDSTGLQIVEKDVSIKDDVASTLHADTYKLGDANATGTYTGAVKYVAVQVNGTVFGKVPVNSDGTYRYYIKDKVASKDDAVAVLAYDATGEMVAEAQVTIDPGVAPTLSSDEFTIGTTTYVSGKYTGGVKYVGLKVGDTIYSKVPVSTDGTYQYYAKDKVKNATDVVTVLGYDATGNVAVESIVKVN